MAEPNAEVPVSLPTREQIAEAIDAWWESTYPRAVMLEEVEQLKSVVLALLSEQTPAAEHKPDWSDWGIDHPEEGPNCSCGFNGSFEECAAWRAGEAEPPRIEDMAPGTTFTAEFHGERDMFFRCRDSLARAGRYLVAMGAIDPSTIREVTPPKDAA